MNPTLAPLLFLDFDGVLHPNGATAPACFSRAAALTRVLDAAPEAHVVVSSSWRFHHTGQELLAAMPSALAARVVACTGPALPGRHQRHREIVVFIERHARCHPWRALDDATCEFPTACPELIACNGGIGLEASQLTALEAWLSRLRSCRLAVQEERAISRPDLIEPASRLLSAAPEPSVALLQRTFRVGHAEALALLGAHLRDGRRPPASHRQAPAP